ncbi:substrate-binding domain-containing protein [Nitrospira sp. NS4]|uniref:substrate-binding domain-containing protein n=1 Tax=Nitrospira sp. NS4 TaxID=3414498 RepID=UPI003C2F6036
MKCTTQYMSILAGALALAGLAGTAEAQTALNAGGSSAGRNFATDVPLNLCDAAPLPSRFASADNNKITWVCNRGGLPVIMRYSATGSSDGVNKLLQPASNPASNMLFLDHTLTTGCTGPTLVTRPADGKQYNNTTGCNNANTISLPVHLGASDVQGASFHQSGPLGTTVSPLDDSTLTSVTTAIVPFSIFVGKGVVKLDAAGTGPAGAISGLSRLEIERIFSKQVTDWRQLGYGTVTDAAPGVLEATSPITLCMRSAGSGTKAAFDETVMINATETLLANTTSVFSSSSSGVLTCLAGNRRSVGYMDADAVVSFNPGGANNGLAYVVRLDGGLAHDPSLTDPKRDLKCGKYAYWAGWRLNRRTASEGAAIDALAQAYVDNASAQTTIAIIPTGAYWASDEEMAVSKNVDKGPLIWKAGAHPECR